MTGKNNGRRSSAGRFLSKKLSASSTVAATTVLVATVRTQIPEAGGMTEIQRITAARNATTTAQAWWQSLSAADRASAQRRFEAGPLSSGQ